MIVFSIRRTRYSAQGTTRWPRYTVRFAFVTRPPKNRPSIGLRDRPSTWLRDRPSTHSVNHAVVEYPDKSGRPSSKIKERMGRKKYRNFKKIAVPKFFGIFDPPPPPLLYPDECRGTLQPTTKLPLFLILSVCKRL